MEYHSRKHPRLKSYDYSQNGYYFITICTKNKECILSWVGKTAPGKIPPVYLTETGRIVKRYVDGIEAAHPGVYVDRYIIMPNHVHLILVLDDFDAGGGQRSGRPTVQTVVHGFKVMVTKAVGHSIWQSSFYEHVIRNKQSYAEICNYILGNPGKWTERNEK